MRVWVLFLSRASELLYDVHVHCPGLQSFQTHLVSLSSPLQRNSLQCNAASYPYLLQVTFGTLSRFFSTTWNVRWVPCDHFYCNTLIRGQVCWTTVLSGCSCGKLFTTELQSRSSLLDESHHPTYASHKPVKWYYFQHLWVHPSVVHDSNGLYTSRGLLLYVRHFFNQSVNQSSGSLLLLPFAIIGYTGHWIWWI